MSTRSRPLMFDQNQNTPEEGQDTDKVNAWNKRLIAVIIDCEDDVRRYRGVIQNLLGERECNAPLLVRCMDDEHAHRHLILFTALHIVALRFQQAGGGATGITRDGLTRAAGCLHQHIDLIGVMMAAMFRQIEQEPQSVPAAWNYGGSLLADLIERRLRIAIDDTVALLDTQFSCTLVTVMMAAIEPSMKSVQDRLSLRPELPLDMRAFAGARLGLKCSKKKGAVMALSDLAADISQILKIPRTICLSA